MSADGGTSPGDADGGGGPSDGLSWEALQHYYQGMNLALHLVPLPAHRLVYVKNPKAGSSTLMVWLDRLHTGVLDRPVGRMHRDHHLPTVREVGRREVLRMLGGEAYRFSFVRHPVRRLESVYRAKMQRHQSFRRKVAPDLGISPDPEVPVSFEEFLEAVEQQDPLSGMNPHWRPQHLNLLHPTVTLDHVGRLESFETDLERICAEAGLERMPVEAANVAPASSSDSSVFDGRADLVRRVEELYARDRDLYGY